MSVPEDVFLAMKAFKPGINRFVLGQLVFELEDTNKRIMVVSGILPYGNYNNKEADYYCSWLTNRGKEAGKAFLEKELKEIKE